MKYKVAALSEIVEFINSPHINCWRAKQAELMCMKIEKSRSNDFVDIYSPFIKKFGLNTLNRIVVMALDETEVMVRKHGALRRGEIKQALPYTRLVAKLMLNHHEGKFVATVEKKGQLIWGLAKYVKPGAMIEIDA